MMEEKERHGLAAHQEQPVRQLTQSVEKLTFKDTMEYPRDSILDRGVQLKQELLKKDVLKVLRRHDPVGVAKGLLWDIIKRETRRPELSAKMFGVIKLKDLPELRWKDEIETYCPNPNSPNMQYYRIRPVPLSQESVSTVRSDTETLRDSNPGHVNNERAAAVAQVSKPKSDLVEESLGAKRKKSGHSLTRDQLSYIAGKLQSHLTGAGKSGMKLRKFTKHLRIYLKEFGDIHGFREDSTLSFLNENFSDLVSVDTNHKHKENYVIHLKRLGSPAVRDPQEETVSVESGGFQSKSTRSSTTESGTTAKKHTWSDIASQGSRTAHLEKEANEKIPVNTENVPTMPVSKEKPKSAMELLSSLSAWGKPAATPGPDVKQNKKQKKPLLNIGRELQEVISVPDDDDNDEDDIQLVEMEEANSDKDVEIVKEEKPKQPCLLPIPVQITQMPFNQFQANFFPPQVSVNPQFLWNMQHAMRQSMAGQPLISQPPRVGSILPGPLPSFLVSPNYQQTLGPQPLHSPSGVGSPQFTATKLPNMGRPVQLDEDDDGSSDQDKNDQHGIAGPSQGLREERERGPHVHSYLMAPEPSHAHVRADTIDLTVKPVDTQMFEQKMVNVSPIFVPRGQMVTREFVDNVAKECIEALAEANESVTLDRVEKLICQRFNIANIRLLNIGYVDQLNSVNELNRMLNKVNTYILGFVKVRCICTLYELEQALKEYEPNKQDFKELKLGPLQRLPVVYQQFRFPPDMMQVPEITSMDILDHFHNFLTRRNLWTAKLELEPFMEYLVETYEADNAYQLGVRVRSLPLMAGILKKAQRDCGNNRREITEHMKSNLRSDIGDAFRKFRASLLQTGTGDGMEVRTHYMKVRPEIVLQEVMEKFNLLLLTTKMGLRTTGRITKVKKVVEDFLTTFRNDMFLRDILHLTICMSNTALEETTLALLTPPPAAHRDDEGVATEIKPPPKKDALTETLKKYIERCLNAGALSLVHLDRIEEKLLEDFSVASFPQMGYGRFLEFLLAEAKQMLEESGGLVMGSGSSGATDGDTVSFKPHQADLMEFLKQCQNSGITQPAEIEDALCRQFGVRDVRNLGHGNITRLLSLKEKHGRYSYGDVTVVYECTLAPSTGPSVSVSSKVGILGHQTRDAAKICLHNCPLLEDMAAWSQWPLVFEPELGKLKDFVQKYGGVSNKTVEGGQLATLDFMGLETEPGHLLKIVSTTSPEHFARALERLDPVSTSGHLVSMAVAYKGVVNMPLALLTGHMKTVLLQVYANEGSDRDSSGNRYLAHAAARFVLQCLLKCPLKVAVALANQLFLEPLGQVMGSTSCKQLLPSLCASVEEQNMLTQLGCLLGVQEWTRLVAQKCQLPESAIQIISREMEELYTEEQDQSINQDEEEYEEEDDVVSDTEDVDEILAGDLEVKRSEDEKAGPSDAVAIATEKTDEPDVVKLVDDDVEMENATTAEAPKAPKNTCEDIVNEIRRDEFGIGVQLSEDGQRLMKVQQDRLGRSLDRLSKDLYSKDTHFVLELIQNADDNNYAEELYANEGQCPSVKFVIDDEGIRVYNNESGFREKDIRALCDVGRSTKGKHKFGYIGQKGIGFKSVFRVTDCPEVHSNGFHIKFDVNSGSMGYILPHWVHESQHPQQHGWMTHISLTLKPNMRLQTRTLAARFNDIHPSLLLFLHRLREITIDNKIENGMQKFRRRDVGDNIIEIQHTHGTERWLVVKRMLDATKISLQAKSGAEVESTEVALAFPLRPAGLKSAAKVLPPKQPVFAFLPLRSYGFRFIIQGDFDVPSSREDVDRDSSWNQWLRSEIHTIFIEALDAFKSQNADSPLEAVCTFLQFVPMEDEVLDFFKPVASDILKKLKARPCVPTQPDEGGVISWKLPSQTVQVRDPLVRTVVTPSLLATHLNLFYLNHEVAAMLNPALTACLGIETLTSEHLFQLGKALVVNMENKCSSEDDVLLIARWLACMYRSLDEFHEDQAILEKLKSHRILPLTDGELVSLNEKTVFCPVPQTGGKKSKKTKDPLYHLRTDMSSLHPGLLNTSDSEVNSQVQKLLLRLGIKQLSPFDVINHHILPVLQSGDWQQKLDETLVSYLVYIKEELDKQPSLCNLDTLKDVAIVMTNQGRRKVSQVPVHFPPQYGNDIDLQAAFSGYDWTLLDPVYLPAQMTKAIASSWFNFFQKLGVEKGFSVRKRDVVMKKKDLADSLWSTHSQFWPQEEEEYIVKDYFSEELSGLIQENKFQSTGDQFNPGFVQQMKTLCSYLDKYFSEKFSPFTATSVVDKDGKVLKETETSIGIVLKKFAWLPAIETKTSVDVDGFVNKDRLVTMKESGCLYLWSDPVEKIFADKVLYLDARLQSSSLIQFLGLKNSVEIDVVRDLLLSWSRREKPETPATFCTSLTHIKNVYDYLSNVMSRQDFQTLLRDESIIFVPNPRSGAIEDNSQVVAGKMLKHDEVWIADKTGLFDKHRSLLEEFHTEVGQKRTIMLYYRDRTAILDMFVQEGKVDRQPRVEEYIELLVLLCTTELPKDTKVLTDVLHILTVIGQALVLRPEEMQSNPNAEFGLNVLKDSVKKKLQNEKVFPSKRGVWVGAADLPLIADNKDLEAMFAGKEWVHFIDVKDKTPQKSKTSPTKVEKTVQWEHILVVMEICGIRNLSSVLEIRPAPEMIKPCPDLQMYFHQIMPLVQQYLMARYEDIYMQLEELNTRQMLAEANFFQTKKLEVTFWLMGMGQDTFMVKEEKCAICPPTFYFHEEHLGSLPDINREVARYFSRGNNDCYTSLRSFLSELCNIIAGNTEDTPANLLARHNADETPEIPEGELWLVPAPKMPESAPEPEPVLPDEGGDSEMAVGGENVVTVLEQEGAPVMRAWPPVAEKGHGVRKVYTKGEEVSKIWPPPEVKDYMRQIRDLPASVRVVDNSHDQGVDSATGTASPAHPNNEGVRTTHPGDGVVRPAYPVDAGVKPTHPDGVGVRHEVRTVQGHVEVTEEPQEQGEGVTAAAASGQETEIQRKRKLSETEEQLQHSKRHSSDLGGLYGTVPEDHELASVPPHHQHHHQHHYFPAPFEFGTTKHPRKGDPIWKYMVTDYAFDELGTGTELQIPGSIVQSKDMREDEHGIGRWGEELVDQYLRRQLAVGNIASYEWNNSEEETGSPYDFVVNFVDENGTQKDYVEVKSTKSSEKGVFEISVQQIKFAEEMKDKFHIFRVFNAGNMEKVRLIRIYDLNMRLSQKQVKLCMLI